MNTIKAKMINMFNTVEFKNVRQKYINTNIQKDQFIKHKYIDKDKLFKQNKLVEILSRHDYDKISKSLEKDDYWTDSVNYVAFNKMNNKIDDVTIGLFNQKTAETDIMSIKLDDFIKLYTKMTSNQMDLHPKQEQTYKNQFKDLMTYIAKNRKRE